MTGPRKTRLAESVSFLAEIARKHKTVNGKPGMNISVERYGSGWEDNIGMDITDGVYVDQ